MPHCFAFGRQNKRSSLELRLAEILLSRGISIISECEGREIEQEFVQYHSESWIQHMKLCECVQKLLVGRGRGHKECFVVVLAMISVMSHCEATEVCY